MLYSALLRGALVSIVEKQNKLFEFFRLQIDHYIVAQVQIIEQ